MGGGGGGEKGSPSHRLPGPRPTARSDLNRAFRLCSYEVRGGWVYRGLTRLRGFKNQEIGGLVGLEIWTVQDLGHGTQ